MKKILLCLCLLLFPLFFLVGNTEAAKAKGPSLGASVAKNRLSATASFNGLKGVRSVKYQLTYDSFRGPQGAGGTIKVKNRSSESRRLLFGTCSRRVCTYHQGVKNIKLTADFTLKSGGVISYEKKL